MKKRDICSLTVESELKISNSQKAPNFIIFLICEVSSFAANAVISCPTDLTKKKNLPNIHLNKQVVKLSTKQNENTDRDQKKVFQQAFNSRHLDTKNIGSVPKIAQHQDIV